jgi:hypothetical protein
VDGPHPHPGQDRPGASGADRTVTVGGATVTVSGGLWWVGTLRYDSGIDTWKLTAAGGGSGGGGGGGVPDDASVTNAKVATNAAIDLDKTADSATRLAMTPAERTQLSGLTATLAAKANVASPTFTGTATAPRFVTPPQALSYAATITPNAATGSLFRIVAVGNFLLNEPTGGVDGQVVVIEVLASGGDRTISFGGGGASLITVPSGQWWAGALRYNAGEPGWRLDDDTSGGGAGAGGAPPDGSVVNASVAPAAGITLDKTADFTGGTGRLALTSAERTKLAGVAAGATANATDAQLRDRATHTGTQPISTLATTGTPSSTTYLSGSGAWTTPAGGGAGGTSAYAVITAGATDADIQAALDANAGRTVYIDEGTYAITTTLIVQSGTTIIMSPGTVLQRAALIDNMIRNAANGTTGVYGAARDITVQGGVIDGNRTGFSASSTLLTFGHAERIRIRDVRFIRLPGWHAIELNAVRDGRVEDCTFEDQVASGEAMVQIDAMLSSGVFPWFGPYDLTPCNDVVISGCTFRTGRRGIDTHSAHVNNPHRNIRVIGNNFQGMAEEAIYFWHHDNTMIAMNQFADCFVQVYLEKQTSSAEDQVNTIALNQVDAIRAGGSFVQLVAGAVVARMGNTIEGVPQEPQLIGYGSALPTATSYPAGSVFIQT